MILKMGFLRSLFDSILTLYKIVVLHGDYLSTSKKLLQLGKIITVQIFYDEYQDRSFIYMQILNYFTMHFK